ncbi:hypothetical protein IVB41_15570 [Bradyrhizobium sp. 44]|uniref:hypothetical protein n=1 Tax=Bradyrhizobium sp. 44 TaxID=2782675 RepID=UPI001FFAB6D4|nr:hypothetical protein [Bradyrhizobium sp. 44]MCK1285338.1 hypothetical protein [Bradyrhizobium sp. 44]
MPDGLKDDVLRTLAMAKDEPDAKRIYEEWRLSVQSNKSFPNHTMTFEANDLVGRVRYRARFIAHIADLLELDISEVTEFVKWLLKEPSTIEESAASYWFDTFIKDQRIDLENGWYFRAAPRNAAPFSSNAGCLPWRLGLQYVRTGSNYVGFEIDHATLQHPRAAIFIDVNWEMHEYWRPNGKTLPLVGTPAMCLLEGLEELVAGSPKFGEVKKITQLRAT